MFRYIIADMMPRRFIDSDIGRVLVCSMKLVGARDVGGTCLNLRHQMIKYRRSQSAPLWRLTAQAEQSGFPSCRCPPFSAMMMHSPTANAIIIKSMTVSVLSEKKPCKL